MPGLVRAMGRTAVVAGTATAVSNRVSRRQANRWAGEDQGAPPPQNYQEAPPPQPVYQQAPPPPPPPQVVVMEAPPAGAEMDAKLAQLQQLGELKAQGILSAEEFEAQKQRILAS